MAERNDGSFNRELFLANIVNYKKLRQWCLWYPDLWLDSITPDEGKIILDFDQRLFLRIAFRYYATYGVFPRAWGKCVTGDTIIYTDDGMIEIGSLFDYSQPEGEEIGCHNLKIVNKYGKTEKTELGISSGLKETVKIVTRNGYQIEGTLNHPVFVMEKGGNIVFKMLETITKDDYVVINRKNDLFGSNTNINKSHEITEWLDSMPKQSECKIIKSNMPEVLTDELGYLFGLLTGDGCLTRENKVIFSNIDETILNHYYSFINKYFNIDHSRVRNVKCDHILSDIFVRKYLEFVGFDYSTSWEKQIPQCIMKAPKSIVANYLSGLYDTDGTVDKRGIYFCTVSEKLSKQVQVALLNFGIISKRYFKSAIDTKGHFIISITGSNIKVFKDEIGFKSTIKSNKLSLLKDTYKHTNTDIIPYQMDNLNRYVNNISSNKTELKDKLYWPLSGKGQLTYSKMKLIVDDIEYENGVYEKQLIDIHNSNYFYDKIDTIESSSAYVYDINTVDTHSFVGNGLVNHNTFLEVLAMVLLCIIYPNLDYVMTAQTKENAASILGAKIVEIRRFYPILAKEMEDVKIAKNTAEVTFKSGSRMFILANQQQSKGQRSHRMNIEEAALLNNDLFMDVLEPIPAMPRRTVGRQCVSNPMELNGQINFFTTSGFRSSDEFTRVDTMLDEMANLDGQFVIGADWQLACWFGRGVTKDKILKKKENNTPLSFAQNYQSRWVGASDGALVNINTLLNCRVLTTPKTNNTERKEIYQAVDVARSDRGNNQTAIANLEVIRTETGFIKNIDIVNLFTITGDLSFSKQALLVKQNYYTMNCQGEILDSNGLGMGLLDELRKETRDTSTGELYPAFATTNTDVVPDSSNYIRCIFDLKPQSANTDIIVSFIDSVNSGQLRLLMKQNLNDYDINDTQKYENDILPFLNTDILIEEASNLKLKQNSAGRGYSVIKNLSKIDKDRWAASAYGIWFIRTFKNNSKHEKQDMNAYIISSKGKKKEIFKNCRIGTFGKRGGSRR